MKINNNVEYLKFLIREVFILLKLLTNKLFYHKLKS